MNKIYKSIWNAITHSWTAVSEAQRSKGKASKCVKASIFLGPLLLSVTAFAYDLNRPIDDTSPIIIGVDEPMKEEKSSNFMGNNYFVIETQESDLSSSTLFNLSSTAYEQILLKTQEYEHGLGFVSDVEGLRNLSVQNTSVTQRERDVATLTFATGSEAFELISKNATSYQSSSVEIGSDYIRIQDDEYGWKNYESNGLAAELNGNDVNQDGYFSFLTLAVLKQIDIDDGKTLVLDDITERSQTWSAKITGNGNITYSGTGSVEIKSTLVNGFDDTNIYTGSTTVDGVTLVLGKNKSLGNTSLLNIVGNGRVEANTNTEQVDKLQVNNGILLINKEKFEVGAQGAVIGVEGQIQGQNVSLNVTDGGDLLVQNSNTNLTNSSVTANNITVTTANAFGSETNATANANYIFKGVTDEITNTPISANTVILQANESGTASHITYGPAAAINTNSTLISYGSSLTVTGTSQLGSSVALNYGDNNVNQFNKLTIQGTAGGEWNFGTNLSFSSNDAYAVIVAKGSGAEGSVFTIPEAERSQWKYYQGWLRISNTSFNLNENLDDSIFNDDHVGLSVGSGGQVNVTDRFVKIDRFGWSNDENNNGILDLTGIEPSGHDDTTPILKVGELRMEGTGSIRIDASEYLSSSSALTGGSVLDYQQGDSENRFWVIKATTVTPEGNESVDLIDESNGKSQTSDLNNLVTGYKAAEGTWGYDSELVTEGDDLGVYITYSLQKIKLTGQKVKDNALQLKLSDSTERDLHINVTGAGIIEIDAEGAEKKEVSITNTANDFIGTVNAKDDVILSANEGALGDATALQLGNNAQFILNADEKDSGASQTLNGLQLTGTSQLILNGDLNLNLNDTSTYLQTQNIDILASQLKGSGNLTLISGTVAFRGVTDQFFKDYTGNFTVNNSQALHFYGKEDYTLKAIYGEGDVFLGSDKGSLQITTLGDVRNFAGNLQAGENVTVRLDQNTQLPKELTLLANAKNTLLFDGYRKADQTEAIDTGLTFGGQTGFALYEFKKTDGVFALSGAHNLKLTDSGDIGSHIVRTNRDTLDTSAQIDANSSLTYQFKDGNSGEVLLVGMKGDGSLGLEFATETELSVQNKDSFGGQLRFENAIFEVGDKHSGDVNNGLARENALYVDSGSTLLMNGQQTFGKDLTLGGGSVIDFSTDSDSFVITGTSANAMHMNDNSLIIEDGENVKVDVKVDTSIQIQPANVSGTLMEAVRESNDSGLSLVLIDGIKGEAEEIANHMTLNGTQDVQSAVATYKDSQGTAIADLKTGIGLDGINDEASGQGQIGLTYDEVTEMAIYDGQTALLEATGKGDVISAKITDKDHGKGSVHYTGVGQIKLTNSDNDYTGKTLIDGSADVVADAANALGRSEQVIVGGDNSQSRLTVNYNQDNVRGLQVTKNASLNFANSAVMTLTDSQDSFIEGNLDGDGTIALVNSTVTYKTDVEKTLSVAFDTKDSGSTFVKTGAGKLGFDYVLSEFNMTVSEGSVAFKDGDSLGSLSMTEGTAADVNGKVNIENLSGSGVFNMTVAFGETNQQARAGNQPGLQITNGTGQHYLNVTAKDANKGAEERIEVVQIENGDATFALWGGLEAITSGGYDYQLVKNTGVNGGSSYFLDSQTGAENVRNTTVTAGSYIGIAYAAQLFDLSLHDRVGNRDWINPVTGEKQTTSLWMHHTMSHERFRDSTSQLRMRTTSNTTMLGGDFVQFTTGNTGLAYAGLMGGYGTMDTKSHSKMTNLHSKAETDAWGVGAYAGWKADSDGQTGPYVDGWLMFTHASSDVTGVDRNTEDVKGEGLSASIEAGWGFKVGSAVMDNGKVANLTVEPHASVTWFGMQYDEIHNDAQDVKFEGTNNVRTRLGARAIVTEEGNKDFNAFVEANWVHNTQEYGATISGLRVDQAGSRNLGEARIGLDWHVTDSLSVWGRVGASYGSDAYSEREGSIGVRYQF